VLCKETKWTRFPISNVRDKTCRFRLGDLFTVKRGVATGNNKFFILTKEQVKASGLPEEVLRPILPSPRYVPSNKIDADSDGLPILDRQLFLLDCRMPEIEVRARYPKLWEYLEKGKRDVLEGYLCQTRKIWYSQEWRAPAPILCTYLGRGDTKSGHPFRFILNHSEAIAANVYLLLYPKPALRRAMAKDTSILQRIWEALNLLSPSSILEEGRVYGGGLHKLEPKELENVNIDTILSNIPELQSQNISHTQIQFQLI
jgi:hypothetical protein